MKDETKISITAIIGLVILEGFAIAKGIDGALLSLVVTAIAGLAGYNLKKILEK